MPHRNSTLRTRLVRLLFFSLVAWALVALGRSPRPARLEDAPLSETGDQVPGWASSPASPARRGASPRRLAASFAFAVLFFAGASFTAVAGDRAVGLLDSDEAELGAIAQETETSAAAEEPAPAEAPAEAEPAAPEPAEAPAEAEELMPSTEGGEAAAAEPAPSGEVAEPEPVPAAAPAAEDESEPAHSRGAGRPE
ncbi:MAG: hypothetical protein ACRDON_01795, partial [Gaiellaceae bacterium]